IVDNETDNDWDGVQLTLVSGRPISFIEDLYQPLYVQRPVVQPQASIGVTPPVYAGGAEVEAMPSEQPRAAQSFMNNSGRTTLSAGGGGGEMTPEQESQSVQPQALGEAAGELFEYTVNHPVDLPRQTSAMIPIIEDPVNVERVSIFNQAVLLDHPLNGVWMTNSTGKSLLAGPVTVYDSKGYAGDASLGDVPQGQRRLLAFGIDLRVLVHTQESDVPQQLASGRIFKGTLELTLRNLESESYEIDNKGDRQKTIVVEHPIDQGYDLAGAIVRWGPLNSVGGQSQLVKPEEKTSDQYRFKIAVDAGQVETLEVTESQTVGQMVAIIDQNADDLVAYAQNGELSDKVKQSLIGAAQRKRAVADTEGKIKEDQDKIDAIVTDQSRIDENLRTISPNSDLYNRLMKKLGDEETQLDALHGDISDLQAKRDAQQKDLEDYIAGLNVD
ncbi:MAG TPA: hypothetical protein VMD30_06035, partial [Tepidisphaeraceae bacterium]|nr:hypothetical protein [Tepidisphaeraceae bacterium]